MDGTPVDGEWVYGGVLQGIGDFSIIYGSKNQNDPGEDLQKWCVYTDTVSQFSGLTDKNGKKIFEGDIIHELDGSMDNIARVVRWDEAYMEYTCPLVKKHWCYGYNECSLWMMHSENIEVIGNIHDNPELLGGNDG